MNNLVGGGIIAKLGEGEDWDLGCERNQWPCRGLFVKGGVREKL